MNQNFYCYQVFPFNLEHVTSIKPIYSESALHKTFGLNKSAYCYQKFEVYIEIFNPSAITFYMCVKQGYGFIISQWQTNCLVLFIANSSSSQ